MMDTTENDFNDDLVFSLPPGQLLGLLLYLIVLLPQPAALAEDKCFSKPPRKATICTLSRDH